jgi:N-acetylglutamate synthase-like GNAT family acetyltransferase
MIDLVDYEIILDIWQNHLWSNRISKIESHSAMLLDRSYSIKNFDYVPSYFVYLKDNKIAGCNSGHMCSDGTFRSRGLFVFEEYRGNRIGVELLERTIQQARTEHASCIWSYPRQSSWNTYCKAGFTLVDEWENSEMSINAYCKLDL